ncbi:trans-1,2-dihydrobenzene-1,2-diol dehydrogenase-like [Lytechinus pictus]|uniref:trans-1,2-dihydrobenzene-1,2-diol dehydrogenase-like n=1 Tax=Lytechinus pictus TaxID=7653 RepID=UPI0030B9F2B1
MVSTRQYIVYIGSINTAHFPLCKLFLEAKKHVLCEKPLGVNAKEVGQMIDLAKKNGVFFMEAIWSRFFPAYEKIRSLVSSGELGEVKCITGDFCIAASHIERLMNKSLAGGALIDIGIYLVQLATMVFGPDPILVQGVGGLTETGVDETCSITLQYPDSKVASLLTSLTINGNNEASIIGTKGRINLRDTFHAPSVIEIVRGYPAPGLFKREVIEFPLPKSSHPTNFINSGGLGYQAEAIRIAVEEGKTEHPLVSWSESLAIHRIMDKLRHDVGYFHQDEETDKGTS